MAKKGNRQFVLMSSKEDKAMRYTTKVNVMNLQTKQGQAFKLKLRKYSPALRKHVEFTQTKIK